MGAGVNRNNSCISTKTEKLSPAAVPGLAVSREARNRAARGIEAEIPQHLHRQMRGIGAESSVLLTAAVSKTRPKSFAVHIFFSLLFCLCAVFLPAAESRALVKFLDESGIELSWESELETGRLSFGPKTVSFRVGEPWLLLDSEGKVPCEALRKTGGTLQIPEATEQVLRNIFFPPRSSGEFRIGAIFIDAGHGGRDPGTVGRHTINGKALTLNEKDLVLDTALLLDAMLKKRFPGKRIVLSRRDDTFLELEERTALAHAVKLKENEAIVFISIHANASLNPKAKGYEVWYLPSTYRRQILSENDVAPDSREILPIMNDMLEEGFTLASISLAQDILAGFDKNVGKLSENRGLKDELWAVVKAKMPAVLVEIGFVTNRGEALLLNDKNHLRKIAQAIYSGIDTFVRQFEGGVSGL